MPSLHLFIPHLSSRWNWKKTTESRWTCFGVRVTRTLDYPIINLNLCQCAPYDQNARPSQTDRQTDEHHGNSATIRSDKCIVHYSDNNHNHTVIIIIIIIIIIICQLVTCSERPSSSSLGLLISIFTHYLIIHNVQ